MLKKVSLFLVVFLIILNIFPMTTSAEELSISAPNVVLIENSTGKVLYEKGKDKQCSIASITKVMTLLLTMESIDSGKLALDDVLTASEHAASMGGSDIWLKPGEKMTVDDLLKATFIMSANDAAVVLAEAIAGTEEVFVAKMNERATELGMINTVFKNCNGLDADGHISTAHDVALMSIELAKHTEIQKYTLTWMDYIRDGKTQLVNTNKLIKSYVGITGLKTGTTSTAGSCITATATRNGMDLTAVILGAPTTQNRFEDAATLLNYGFAKWSIMTPVISVPANIEIKNGMKNNVGVSIINDINVLIETAENTDITSKIELYELTVPIKNGQSVGILKIMNGKECLKEISLFATEDVEKATFFNVLTYFLKNL